MKSLCVKNFRSIENSGEIELKPISIFLGKNSCGKSSFMRLLPLLKQTLESDVNEPLLWYGDYVDFGDFKNILPTGSMDDFIELSFNLAITPYLDNFLAISDKSFKTKVALKITEKYIKEVAINYFDQDILISFKEENELDKIVINGQPFTYEENSLLWEKNKNKLIPSIYEKTFPKQYMNSTMMYYYYRYHEKTPNGYLQNEIIDVISIFTSNSTEDVSKIKLFQELSTLHSKKLLLKKLRSKKSFKRVVQYFADRDIDDETFIRLNNLIVFDQLNFIIEGINKKLNEIFENTYYLKPIRVNAERYYRIQGITINKVDADGSNLPMIFYNMSDTTRLEFEKWCLEKFDLFFSVETTEGHVSIIVQDQKGNKSNLVDTGYGFSQVLPIIVQLWLLKCNTSSGKRASEKEILLVIEQPELHLHPAFQAKLMEVFVALIREMQQVGIKFKIVFETHSETMINRLGYLISQEKLKKELVNIILVEKENQGSQFKQVGFTNDGFVEHWPIGFMSPEE